ncbi:actin-like ATPase domain-containing protein, partial [Backusella circina FSU 941]
PKQSPSYSPKIPTVLYYDEDMKYLKKIGGEANNMFAKRKKNGVLLKHFKLLLSNGPELGHAEKPWANMENFEVVDAVANFLRDFTEAGLKKMRQAIGDEMKLDRLGFVIAIPPTWSHEAKNTMKAAVKRANLVSGEFESKIMFITEAEAAAIYCEKYFSEEFRMDKHQRFMICDAGGGTVDLATYEVTVHEKLGEELVLKELTSSDCESTGSSHLDERFRKYLLKKMKESNIEYNESGIDDVVAQFCREIKPSLNPDLEEDIKMELPLSLGINSDNGDESDLIVNDEISFNCAELENEVFKPCIDRILKLIERQLKKIPEGERQLDAILVVGGFGQSSYLYKKIVDKFENKAIGAKFIGKPPNGDLAISRGAVSFGLEPRTVSTNITRYSYGLQVKDHFNERRDNVEMRVEGYNGDVYCQNVFSPLVSKDKNISRGTVYIHKVYVMYPSDPIFGNTSSEANIHCLLNPFFLLLLILFSHLCNPRKNFTEINH